MQIGIVGLGKMGSSIARRLCRANIHAVGYDAAAEAVESLSGEPGFQPAFSLDALLLALKAPRTVWCLLPAGAPTQRLMDHLYAKLAPGDRVIDGANGHYREAMARAARFEAADIGFVDAGVSGGMAGLADGHALMLGGQEEEVASLERVWRAIAPHRGQWLRCGPPGAGHFVQMIHGGIEHGLMQAYAEGFALMKGHPDFEFDLAAIAGSWLQGGVVRSRLLELTREILAGGAGPTEAAPELPDSGGGRWTAQEAIDRGVAAPVLTAALLQRFANQGRDDFAARLLDTMRNRLGHT